MLVIKTAKGEVSLPGNQLLEMPRQPPPGDNGGMGWPLDAILQKAGVTKYQKLIATDSKGTNLTLEKQDLVPAHGEGLEQCAEGCRVTVAPR